MCTAETFRRGAIAALLLLAGWRTSAQADEADQDGTVYRTMGAPSNPAVEASWNRYHSYAESTQLLESLARAYPKLARLQSLGKSYGGRDMWVMTITNFDQGQEGEKPGFWIDGGIHANEIQSVEVALYTAWYLLEAHGHSDFITRLLRERVFYIMPMMSPDSRDAHMQEPNTTHSPRSGQRPVDDDRDGLVDEDGADDLDGDDNIEQMRIRDVHGKWKVHADYPQLMVYVRPEERGEYSLLGVEGVDNDGDGLVNEDGDGYYDPNRGWAWNWQPQYIQSGAHHYPFSIEETRMVADFVVEHPNIGGAQSYHNAGGMILRGPGAHDDQYEQADLQVFTQIGQRGEQMLPGYRYLNVADDLYEVYGGEVDWFYAMRGVFQFTNELFTAFNLFRRPSGGGFFGQDEDLQAFNKYLLFGDGIVPWHEVDHPQYGKVELGGYTKQWIRQPPSFLLEEECHRNMAFTLYHADQLALIGLDEVSAKKLPGSLVQITATLTNDRITPTRAAVDVKHRLFAPDTVEIQGENLHVVAGFSSDDRFFEGASEQKRRPEQMLLDPIPSMGVRYLRWIVTGAGPFTIHARTIRAGNVTSTVAVPAS